MALYHITRTQIVPAPPEKVWDYFTSHNNLKEITPAYMGFDIVSHHPEGEKVYPGMIINYKLRPLLGIPLAWMTEITHVREGEYFVDEQRHGPYAIWHHQHFFRRVEGGTEMRDLVDYKLPLGFIGNIAHRVLIKKMIEQIFDYRYKRVEEIFRSPQAMT